VTVVRLDEAANVKPHAVSVLVLGAPTSQVRSDQAPVLIPDGLDYDVDVIERARDQSQVLPRI